MEFFVPQRPLSLQASTKTQTRWRALVGSIASSAFGSNPMIKGDIRLTIVYLCGDTPADTDNIIKPIQDALQGIVYHDDHFVTDVDAHRRPFNGEYNVYAWPPLLVEALELNRECVYVRVDRPQDLEEYL